MVKAVVKEVVKETPGVVLVRFAPEGGFDFKPGQFLQVLIDKEGKTLRKSYSIISPPSNHGYVELCIKVVENGFTSNYLASLKPSDVIEVAGPFGHFVLQDRVDNDIVFIATGTGISAPKPMIDSLFERGTDKEVWLFFGVRAEADIIYRSHFESLASRHSNFHFIPVLSNSSNSKYEHGYVQDVFKKHAKPNSQDVYICGLYDMVDAVKKLCEQLGYPMEKIHYEKYV